MLSGFRSLIIVPFCSVLRWFFNRAEKVHFLVLSIAIISGGIWTFYTFDVLNQRDKASAELKEIQDRIKGTNASNIHIAPSFFELEDGKFGLITNVSIQNTGTQDVLIDWSSDDTPLSVYKVRIENGDKQYFERLFLPKIYAPFNTEKKKKEHYKSLYLLVGARKELSFYVELPSEGIYYVTFKADADEKLRKEIVEKSGQTAEWFSSKYIHIKPDEKVRFENYIRASHVFAK
ncbi:hypothetical protein AB6D84_04365 [Vibrio lentus]